MRINTHLIKEVSAMLHEMLGDEFDPETFWDTLDGETDITDMIDHLLRDRMDARAMAAAIKCESDALSLRRKRMEARGQAADKALLMILNATGEKKVVRPLATVSRRVGAVSVEITDEAALPSQLCKTVVTPDKGAIKAQLQAGELVPGAALTRGEDGVTVRVA